MITKSWTVLAKKYFLKIHNVIGLFRVLFKSSYENYLESNNIKAHEFPEQR